MTHKPLCNLLVASCDTEGGIYRLALNDDGTLTITGCIPMDRPMYFIKENGIYHAILRAPFAESNESGYLTFTLDKTTSSPIPTGGVVAAHLDVREDDVYIANYLSGTLCHLDHTTVTHEGHSIDPKRQTSPHPHFVTLSPCGNYVLVCDLGLDRLLVYSRALDLITAVSVPDGHGPRHLVFSVDGAYIYLVNEMGGSLSVFSFSNGTPVYIKTINLLPDGVTLGAGAAIKRTKDGRRLYLTERITKSILTFSIDGEDVRLLCRTPCKGDEPRDIALVNNEEFLVVTNQFSDSVGVFRAHIDGTLTHLSSFSLKAPLCVMEE